MISFNDYKKPDGSVDWRAHKAAQLVAGWVCSRCSQYIIWLLGDPSGAKPCNSCKRLGEDEGLAVSREDSYKKTLGDTARKLAKGAK